MNRDSGIRPPTLEDGQEIPPQSTDQQPQETEGAEPSPPKVVQ